MKLNVINILNNNSPKGCVHESRPQIQQYAFWKCSVDASIAFGGLPRGHVAKGLAEISLSV